MKQRLRALLLSLGAACALSTSAGADDCICSKIPMYPVPGGYWFHYAVVADLPTETDPYCRDLYPTGHISEYTSNQQCSWSCGTCYELPGRIPAPPANLHFDEPLKAYRDLDEPNEFRAFLNLLAHRTDDIYADYNFLNPQVLELRRTINNEDKPFYAVSWTIESVVSYPRVGKLRGWIGVEILRPDGVEWTPVERQCNAVDTQNSDTGGPPTHVPVAGLLQVKVRAADCFVASYIRLHRPSNQGAIYAPCNPPEYCRPPRPPATCRPMCCNRPDYCAPCQPACCAPQNCCAPSPVVYNCASNCGCDPCRSRRCRCWSLPRRCHRRCR